MAIGPIISGTQNFMLSNLNSIGKKEADTLSKLASGKRINKGSDDVVGLMKAQTLSAGIRGLETANSNVSTTSSMVNVASGGLFETLNSLQSLRELAVQAADDTISSSDRDNISAKAGDLLAGISQTANAVSFNGNSLLNGNFTDKNVQVGAGSNETMSLSIDSATTSALGVNNLDFSSSSGASSALSSIDAAITQVSSSLAKLGSSSNRLDAAYDSNRSSALNLTRARSTIEDLDMAKALGEIKSQQISKQMALNTLAALNQTQSYSLKLFT